MVSETGLGVLQVVNAVAKGLVEQKTKSGLIDSIVGSANHDASEEELSGIKTAMQRNYSKADLHTLSNHIMDANNFLTFSKEKGAGYKIPNSPWFISTHQTSTSGTNDSQHRMNTYTTSMAQVNELMANSHNAGVPMDMTTAIRKVYKGLGYIKQTEWREAVHGTGQEAKVDRVKMRLLEDNFNYIQSVSTTGDPRQSHQVITEHGYDALLELGFGKGTNDADKKRNLQENMSYGDMLRILKEHPESPVVDLYYSLLAQAIEGSAEEPDRITRSQSKARDILTEIDDDGFVAIFDKAAENALSGLFTSSQEATDLPAIRSIQNDIRRASGSLNQTVDNIYEDSDGNELHLKDKLKLYANNIVSKNIEVTNILLSKPELREPYLDYIYSSLLQVYREQSHEQSMTNQILGSDDKDAQNQRLEKLHRRY